MQVEPSRLRYRPDIDGLRGIAVILVVLCHVGLHGYAGGYVGVDVFFVISGYLIGRLLLGELESGQLRLGRFYQRRFRRIMPALLTMMLIVSVFAYRWMDPPELGSFGPTVLGALFSVANIVLQGQHGYFDPASRTKPLLHTWSLSVEEQFYLVFPLVLYALVRWGGRWRNHLLFAFFVLCFAVGVVWTKADPAAAYFLAPSRAWELLLGALLAAGVTPSLRRRWQQEAAVTAGLLLIFWAGHTFSDATPFPGWSALAPAVGAALVLAAGETGKSTMGTALGCWPLRVVGLISYSVYLWHWPLIVFQTSNHILLPDRSTARANHFALIAASLVVGAMSWLLIEQPFRTTILGKRNVLLFGIWLPIAAVLAIAAIPIARYQGFHPPYFFPAPAQRAYLATAPSMAQTRGSECEVEWSVFQAQYAPGPCLHPAGEGPLTLLAGDSHAAHLYWGLHQALPGTRLALFAPGGCPPTVEQPDWRAHCEPIEALLFGTYLPDIEADTVILSARWYSWDIDHLDTAIQQFRARARHVVVIGPELDFDQPLPRLLEISRKDHDPDVFGRHELLAARELDAMMKARNRKVWHVTYISTLDTLCTPDSVKPGEPQTGGCPLTVDGAPLLYDANHFSLAGELEFTKQVVQSGQLP